MRRALPFLLLGACGRPEDPAPPEHQLLTTTDAWRVATGLIDPWNATDPTAPDCDPLSYGPTLELTEPSFSVQTDFCNPITIVQPLAAPIAAGDHLCFRIWHDVLFARDPGEARVQLWIDGAPFREWTAPIPDERDTLIDAWDAEGDIPAGAIVQLHLGNHGTNSWNILEWRMTPGDLPAPECPVPPPPDGTGIPAR
jgi:hypothetical protein